jgi:beta-1,4-mannosyltransferase
VEVADGGTAEAHEPGRVLGAADLGLCLHRSSSGLDLPMKVADLFGAGLPAVALDYGPCLTELIAHGDTGLLFSSAATLATALSEPFAGFPGETPLLDRRRANVAARPRVTWEEEWTRQAWPVLRGG